MTRTLTHDQQQAAALYLVIPLAFCLMAAR